MIRTVWGGLALAALGACMGPESATQASRGVPSPGVAFVEPMDPGTVTCAEITASPAALSFATDWAAGQLRARIMQGRGGPVTEADVANQLITACDAPGADALRLQQVTSGMA